ncbi:hypothetical protein R6Q57_022839 [Mikania cordata]
MTLSRAFVAEVDDKRNEVTENLFSTSCVEKLSKAKIKDDKYEYSSTVVANMIDVQNRRKEKIWLGFTKKSDRNFEFTTSCNKPASLTADPVLTDLNNSDNSEVCAESLIVTEPDSSPLSEQVNKADSTITPEAVSKLNPNCEPYILTGSLEQASTSSFSGLSDCDVKPFDPKEFHDKNQKVTPKAKPARKPIRTDDSFKTRMKP